MTDLEPLSTAPTAERRGRAARVGRGILLATAVVAIIAQSALVASTAWAVANPRAVSDQLTVWQYDPTPAISGYATRAAMSERGRFLFYASTPSVVPDGEFDRVCSSEQPDIGVLGCYTLADGRIYLYDITNIDLAAFEVVVAAHEMLHAAWDRLPLEQQQSLAEPLEQVFAELELDSELVERIAAYEQNDPTSRIPELYAIVGTELPSIPAELEQHYAEYFDDRSAVVALWQEVEAIFQQLEDELNRLNTELEALSAQIDEEQAAAERAAAALERDITAFNARASRPGGYTSQSAFERDRQALIDRQSALTRRIDKTNATIDRYNELVDEFTALNEQAAALDKDLNIDREPIETTETTE
jgi:predicted  nucleic acid-binding Zn-ribbon protein